MTKVLLSRSLVFLLGCLCCADAHAQAIGNAMVSYLQARVNTRVGGGECAHMATEALRSCGGEFVPSDLGADSPAAGDYVWGDPITTISFASKKWTDSNPTNACIPGDVIQLGAAKIGTLTFPSKHTAVVAAVNANGRPTSIYQQNFGAVRSVKTAAIDVTKLSAGWMRVYRPRARVDASNKWKYTVVNNATTKQTYTVMVGTSTVSSVALTALNTAGSFRTQAVGTTGTVPCIVVAGGQSIYLTNGKGFEIYNPTTTTIGIRQLSP